MTSRAFKPPKGAVRLEIVRGWKGEPIPEQLRPLIIYGFRSDVPLTNKDQKPDCKCVIYRSLPEGLQSGDGHNHPLDDLRVCACVAEVRQ